MPTHFGGDRPFRLTNQRGSDPIVALACDLVPDVQHRGYLWVRCWDQRKEVVQLHKRFGTLEVSGR
jgi:hypothetical protein